MTMLDDLVSLYACGQDHNIVVTKAGTLYAFGDNRQYQLGTRDVTRNTAVPVRVDRLYIPKADDITSASCGDEFCVVLTKSKKLFTWGRNNRGQLGDGTITDKQVPTLITTPSFNTPWLTCGREFVIVIDGSSIYGYVTNCPC
jgi:alpha-tubulin suppressor-like RCC1 family protein